MFAQKLTKRSNQVQNQPKTKNNNQQLITSQNINKANNNSESLITFRHAISSLSNTNRSPNKLSSNQEQSIPQSTMQVINEAQSQLNTLINELDFRLKQNYHNKQQQLILSYKQQLIKAHKDLIELKNNTNQQQIKNQMNQKAFQLKKQRLQLIQTNMYYSNKCLQYKKTLDSVLMEQNQLDRQLKFLEKQIINSTEKKIKLINDTYDQHNLINSEKKNQQNQRYTPKKMQKDQNTLEISTKRSLLQTIGKKTSFSTHANTQTMRKLTNSNSNTKLKSLNTIKPPEIDNDVKKLFSNKLNGSQLESSKFNRYSLHNSIANLPLSKLSKINSEQNNQNKLSEIYQQTNQVKLIKKLFMQSVSEFYQKRHPKRQIGLFKSQQFTDFQKKQIMKNFLAKQDVKQYIYEAIFDKVDDKDIFKKKNKKQKVKIYATQQDIQQK